MNKPGNSGAISMALILNILLVLVIGAAVYYLVTQLRQSENQVQAPPPVQPAPVVSAPPPAPTAAAPAVEEPVVDEEAIQAIKERLQQEQSKLHTLREEEEQIESYLRQAERAEQRGAGESGDQAPSGLITPMGFPDRPPSDEVEQ